MNSRNHIQDELNDMGSSLPFNPAGSPYFVPDGYFEGLAASVLAKVHSEEISAAAEIAALSPLLSGISRSMPHHVPEGFFQATMEELPLITAADESSVVLSFIEKEMPYQVPSGYFESLPDQVLSKIPRPARVVPFSGRKWVRLAAAAMVAGVITLSGILYFRDGGTNGPKAPGSQVAVELKPVDVELKKASSEELDAFIKNNAVGLNSSVTAQNTSSRDVKKFLQDVSDKELNAFLDQIPSEEELDIN
jgi:hypothetical protein